MAPFRLWASPQHQDSPATPIAYDSGKDANTPLQIQPMSPTSLLDVAGQAIRSPALASALRRCAPAVPRKLVAAFWHALEGPLQQHLITFPAATSQGPVQDIPELGSHVMQLLRNLSDPPCSLSADPAVSQIAFAALLAINVLPFPQAAQDAACQNPIAGPYYERAVQALNDILSSAASPLLPTNPDVYAHDCLLWDPSLETAAPAQKQAAPQVLPEDPTGKWHSLPNLDLTFDFDSLSPETSLPGESDIGSTIREKFDFPDTLQGDVDSTPMDYETVLNGILLEDRQQPRHHYQMPIDTTTSTCAPTHHDLKQTTEPRMADILQGFMDDPSIDPVLALPGAKQDGSNALPPSKAPAEDSLYALLPSHVPMDSSTDAILGPASPMQDSPDVLLSSQFPSQDSPIPMLPSQPRVEDTSNAFLPNTATEDLDAFFKEMYGMSTAEFFALDSSDAFLPHMETEGSFDSFTEMHDMSAAKYDGIDPLPATNLLSQAAPTPNATWVSASPMQTPGAAADSRNASAAAPSAGFDCFHTQPQACRQHKRVAKPALGANKPIKKAAGNKQAGASRKGSARAPRRSTSTDNASASSPPRQDPLEADMTDYIQSRNIVGPASAARGFSGVPLHRVSCCMLECLDVHAGFNCPGICSASSLLGF